ncbi:hypothetical protein PI125_g5928 [Phytophthora idaei]|nr:hypothetical protein PI125_g5928 [Phytophthora idaei]
MGGKLLTLRLELQAESEDPNLGVGGKLERDVVAEVVEMATELLMSRATKEDKDALCQWLGILTLEGERLGDPLWEGQARDAADKACDRVGQFLELLDLYPSSQEEQKVEIPTISPEVEKLWTSEPQQLQKLSSDEEEKRQEVARGIEAFLRYDVGKWPECKVEVFGSSMSMFGSPDSDLDMCVLKDSSYLDNEFPGELQGFYYLKRLMERNVWDDHPAESCSDDKMDKLNKTYSQACAAVGRNYSSGDENAAFFDTQSILLVDALAIEYERFSKERKGMSTTTFRAICAENRLQTAKRRKNDLFDLKSIFESEGFEVDTVVAHARIPVLRFRYSRSGLDYKCDLCFDNELSVWNTRLLRAYASFDERARDLGIAVKHWAKQRGVSDTASGFLSSYSYVLMSIYYLQVVNVLPNLQDPPLVQIAEIPPVEHHNKSIAFCEDREIAKIYHEKSIHEGELVDRSLPTLLLGFFKFYTTQFDCINHVVAVRSPDSVVQKTELWGNKAKTWRLSIQDPIQTSRDLGGVLHFDAQRKLTEELRRAHELLNSGESFLEAVCLKE